MKKHLSLLLILAMLLAAIAPLAAAAEEQTALVLPASMTVIEAEAFAGDTGIASVIIPKTVERIESKAFSGCTGLTEVFLGNNADIAIAADAFEGCGDIHFYAYPETKGELYALSHGYQCDLMEEGSSFLNRAVALVEAHGGTSSILQSSAFAAKRLIVRMNGNALPNISAYNPIEIVRDGKNIFFVQFDSVEETINCYTELSNNANVIFVEADSAVEVFDEISGAGGVDSGVWDNDDPMGFDVYAPFVAANGSGKVTIAVLDSGISKKSAYSSILRSDGRSFAGDNQDWSYDPHVHGSVIASIIKDCVGNANVDILPVRVVSENGVASLTLIGVAIKYAVSCGADVINMSLNFEENAYVRYCIDEAVSAGIDVVVAAGNSSRDISKVFPANVSSVITVSGIDNDYELSATSNYGGNVSYCAPDTYVVASAYPGIARKGTSFAAPMIASALALEQLDGYHTKSDLRASCLDLGAEGKDSAYGYGLPQLNKLANIDTTGIELDAGTPAQMAVGESHELKWTVKPANATDKTVSCVTSDDSILTIAKSDDGRILLNAVGAGTATVTVTANNGANISASATITVVQPVTGITVVGAKEKLAIGRKLNLTANVQPENATLKALRWASTNEAVASVDQSGVVTAVAEGTAGIYALATDGYGAQSDIVNIRVVNIPDAESVVLTAQDGIEISDGVVQLQPGETLALNAAILPEDAEQVVTWNCTSSPAGAVTVSDAGVLTAHAVGNAVVSAVAENGVQAVLSVESVVLPTGIVISGSEFVNIGTPVTLTAVVKPENVTDSSVTWTSSNDDIAMVNKNGLVIGVTPGEVQIIATAHGDPNIAASATLTVRQPYTLVLDANGGSCSVGSKTAYSGYAVGDLPTPTRDYYRFDGWYTAAAMGQGERVLNTTVIESSGVYTLYAHWSENALSDWVTKDKVPAGASIINTKTETTTSTASSLSGWKQTGFSWKQTGTGSKLYATFPTGFDQTHSIYTSFLKAPYAVSETATNKRTVSNKQTGYVYWHWMYDCGKSKGIAERAIYNKKGTPSKASGGTGFAYKYFGAWYSTKNYTEGDKGYCNSLSIMNYIVRDQKTSYADCQGSLRWFKFPYYTTTYTDYVKNYSYSRELVQYRIK